MKTEEEIENWYDEEKKRLLEKMLAAIEKKQEREEAEQEYKKGLNKLFEEYKKLSIGIIKKAARKPETANKSGQKPHQFFRSIMGMFSKK